MAQDQIARLEARVDADPGAPEFPAFAEALRRSGSPREAERVARRGLKHKPGSLEGGVALALALLDQGRVDDARRELASRIAESLAARGLVAAPAVRSDFDVTEGELERAFAIAEPDQDQVVDADRVAQNAMREANLEAPEEVSAVADPMFVTRTMADLLESQGDLDAASRIRVALASGASGARTASSGDRDSRQQIIATLESWLANLRREP